MAISEEQESWAVSRVGGLGGTDVTALLGLSKWRSPIDVWQAKVDPASIPDIDSEILWFGRKLEPIIRERYGIHFGCEVTAPAEISSIFPNSKRWEDQTLVIGREPWMLGAADGWIKSVRCGLEVKNVGMKTPEWGEEGGDDIPAAYYCQCGWYNQVYDSEGWNVAPLFSGNRLSQYRIPRDAQFEKDCYGAARAFWHDFILTETEPPIDQTTSYGAYLARKFSLGTEMVIEQPGPDILKWTAAMKMADDKIKEAEEEKQLANNQLRALIADAKSAKTPLGSIGWVRPKARNVVDLKGFFEAVSFQHPEVVKALTSEEQNAPYLRAWWKR